MSRAEFSVATQKAAYARADGICECGCEQPFTEHPKGRPEYDHAIEDALRADNSLENCQCIRYDCHKIKTKERAPVLAKVRREENRRMGIAPKKRGMSYRRFNDDPVWK